MPHRAWTVSYITLLLFITLIARPTSAYPSSAPQAFPELSAPSQSREGYFVLSLSQQPSEPLWLEYSTQANFSQVSRTYPWFGDFERMTLSGFADGEHYFRVRNKSAAAISNVVQVRVDHYPLWQALSLFFIGLVMFLLLAVLIWRNHQRSRDYD